MYPQRNAKPLYRGLTNIWQFQKILENKTTGGFICRDSCHLCRAYCNNICIGKEPPYYNDKVMYSDTHKQVANENIPKIVNIKDYDRYLTEYTITEEIAKRFGLLGYIKIECASCYKSPPNRAGLENSYFCISCAQCTIQKIYIKMDGENKCVDKSEALRHLEDLSKQFTLK